MHIKTMLFIDPAVKTANTKLHTTMTVPLFRMLVVLREVATYDHIVSYSSIMAFCSRHHIAMSDRSIEINLRELESLGMVTRQLINTKAIFSLTPEALEYMQRVKTYIRNKHY